MNQPVKFMVLCFLIAVLAMIGLNTYAKTPEPPPQITQEHLNKVYASGVQTGAEKMAKHLMHQCDNNQGFSFGRDNQFSCSRLIKLNLDRT